MPLTDEEKKEHARLSKEIADEEEALKKIEEEKKAEEEKKRDALKKGDKPAAKEAKENIETLAVSESTAHALLEQMKRQEAWFELLARERQIPEAEIQEVKRGRKLGSMR